MKVERQHVITIVLLLMFLCVAAVLTYYLVSLKDPIKQEAPLRTALEVPEDAKSYIDVAGNDVILTDHYGKKIVVFAWASWCMQCKDGLIELNEFASEKDKEVVSFLMLNRAENTMTTNRYLETLPELTNLDIIIDPNDHFFDSVSGYAMPELVVFDEAGEIILHQQGELKLDELNEILIQ